MHGNEEFFKNNYAFLGSSTYKRCGYNKKQALAIKDKYKKEGIYMLPIKKMAENEMPAQGAKTTEDIYSGVQLAVSGLDLEDQNKIIELSKNIPDPAFLIDQTIALQQYRVKLGLENEFDQGRLLDTTETAISNLSNMIQAKKNIQDGQEINLNVGNTITSLLDEIDKEEGNEYDTINIDIDEAARKQELINYRKENLENLRR